MTDHNARQAGLTVAERTTIQAAKRLADSMGNTWLSSDLETILATHSADARNGEGVALTDEIAERVSKMRNALYAIAQSDPNGYAYELRVIATKAWEESLTLAAPTAPAPTTRDEIEARQRAAMNTRFAGRPTSPATADFDLPAPNDAAPAPAAQADDETEFMRDAAIRTVQAMGMQYTPGADRWKPAFWSQQSATPAVPVEYDRLSLIADAMIDAYKEHYDFPAQGELHMHDCIMGELETMSRTPRNKYESHTCHAGLAADAGALNSGVVRTAAVTPADAASEAIAGANGTPSALSNTIADRMDAASEADKRDAFERWFERYHADACEQFGGIDCTNPKGIAEDAWAAAIQRERQQGAQSND